jgi:hypothetical protein
MLRRMIESALSELPPDFRIRLEQLLREPPPPAPSSPPLATAPPAAAVRREQ